MSDQSAEVERTQATSADSQATSRKSNRNLANEFLEESGYQDRTAETYRSYLYQYVEFLGDKPLNEVKSKKTPRRFINRKVREEGWYKSTVGVCLAAIKEFHRWLEDEYDIDMPKGLERLKSKEFSRAREGVEKEPLSEGEVVKLIKAHKNIRDRLLITLACYTGIRVDGIINIKLKDVDLEKCKIKRVKWKGGETKTVRYAKELNGLMRLWITQGRKAYTTAENSKYLFVGNKGKKLTAKKAVEIVHKAAEIAGIQEVVGTRSDGEKIYRVSFHTLRHAFATLAAKRGIPDRHIQQLLGHADINTTLKYIDETEQEAFKSYEGKFKDIGSLA